MPRGFSQQQPVPEELLGPLVEANEWLSNSAMLRASFAEHGYVLLRNVLPCEDVLEARRAVFSLLADVGEIAEPVAEGIATGTSRRRETAGDLGQFWKTVSEHPALRAVTHGTRLAELAGILFDQPARAHNYLFLRPAPVGNATNLHYDYPFFAGGASTIVTAWVPLGEIPVGDGPLVVVERSQTFDDLIKPMRAAALNGDPNAFARAQDYAYQAATENMVEFVRSRRTRLLTAYFQPGDVILFGGFTMHGSLDNRSEIGRVRLSVDVRYQPASEPAVDPRFFGPNPVGAKGGGYGEQKAAQPLGTPWVAKQ
ncbi:MAG TPA: phytanoyl-CoA dioxygenase family protein [Planctomycetaceae bacterium]|nr:phytanoyl-CoA dioxygenase family protein [Planctomycetaceae bacterium]